MGKLTFVANAKQNGVFYSKMKKQEKKKRN